MNYGNYIYIRYQYYLFNVDLFLLVLYITVCLVVRLFANISSCGPGTVSARVRIFWEFERLDEYSVCESAEKENEQIIENILHIGFCGINETLVSKNVG